MVVLSLVALPFVNIPVYNTLRRFSTLLVIAIERMFVSSSRTVCHCLSVRFTGICVVVVVLDRVAQMAEKGCSDR